MIEAQNLSKRYGEIDAVCDLSFSIAQGEVVGLLGPNGAGKTTTMRMLTTFLAPSSGSAQVAGFDICKEAAEVRANIGYLPETPALYPELKVVEFIRFIAKLKGLRGKKLSSSIDDMIQRCLLADVADRICGQLSRGYRQRVGLAVALVHQPKVIILDEPTSGLDPAQIIDIRQLISDLRKDHTVILSTHILPEVVEICSRVIIISSGRIVVQGALDELTKEQTLEELFLQAISGKSISGKNEAEELREVEHA